VETRKAEAAIRAELGTGVARGSRTVLLVKDDASLRQATRAVLNRLGYQVLEAADGEEALAVWAARRAEIDLVLADMVMPGGLSGLDVARQAMAEKPGVPVIITSSYHTARSELEKRGGAGVIYLPKPCPMQELVGALERCLGGKEEGKAESGKQKVEISP